MPNQTPIDDFTLLCERCGYVIEGLQEFGACPECGQPVFKSLPTRRTGSDWQMRPSFRSWHSTNVESVFHPRQTLDRMRFERELCSLLLWTNILAALVFAWVGGLMAGFVLIVESFQHEQYAVNAPQRLNGAWTIAGGSVLFFPIGTFLLFALTGIEQYGIRFFARRRQWRLSGPVAFAICAHASVGWVVGGVAVGAACVLAAVLHVLVPSTVPSDVALALIPIAAFTGLLTFESLVYIGMRRCKFANLGRGSDVIQT